MKLIGASALVALAVPASAATVIQASDNGQYRDNGLHEPTNNNTFTGIAIGQFRSWYLFDIALSGPAEAVSITFYGNNGSYVPHDGGISETIGVYDYTGSTTALAAGTGGVAAYNDLGTGALLGQHTIAGTALASMPEFTVQLHPTFVQQFNASKLAGQNQIAVGASLLSFAGTDTFEGFWVGSGDRPAAFLTVTPESVSNAVPEPSTWAMMLLGFGAVGAALRSDRRKVVTMTA